MNITYFFKIFLSIFVIFFLFGCKEEAKKANSIKCEDVSYEQIWNQLKNDYITQRPRYASVFNDRFILKGMGNFSLLGERDNKIVCQAQIFVNDKERELTPIDTRYYLTYENSHLKEELVYYSLTQ